MQLGGVLHSRRMGLEEWAGRELGFIECLAEARKLALGIEQRDYHRVLIAARICGDQRSQRTRAGLAIRKLRRTKLGLDIDAVRPRSGRHQRGAYLGAFPSSLAPIESEHDRAEQRRRSRMIAHGGPS